jgi:GntR family transcriptional regulator
VARESSTIVPPSGLQVNRQSSVPVHVQLTTQIRHLIEAGHLKPGVQLPTVRQLAGFLRINRNTAARALADLLRDGYLESQQGRGTFVVERPPTREGRAARSLEVLVEETLERARRLGFTHEELLVTVAARAPYAGMRPRPARVRALLVECNWEELTRYREELETALPVSVDRVLVEELPARMAQEPGFLGGYRVVVTTFFHIHEVKAAVPAEGPPVVALLSKANISTLLRLTELPPGATVGLVCTTATGSQNLLRSVQSAGLSDITPVLASADDPWSLDRMLEQTRVVLCSEQGAARIRKTLPPDVELIVSDRTLDHGGLELLRDLLIRLEQTAT